MTLQERFQKIRVEYEKLIFQTLVISLKLNLHIFLYYSFSYHTSYPIKHTRYISNIILIGILDFVNVIYMNKKNNKNKLRKL